MEQVTQLARQHASNTHTDTSYTTYGEYSQRMSGVMVGTVSFIYKTGEKKYFTTQIFP